MDKKSLGLLLSLLVGIFVVAILSSTKCGEQPPTTTTQDTAPTMWVVSCGNLQCDASLIQDQMRKQKGPDLEAIGFVSKRLGPLAPIKILIEDFNGETKSDSLAEEGVLVFDEDGKYTILEKKLWQLAIPNAPKGRWDWKLLDTPHPRGEPLDLPLMREILRDLWKHPEFSKLANLK